MQTGESRHQRFARSVGYPDPMKLDACVLSSALGVVAAVSGCRQDDASEVAPSGDTETFEASDTGRTSELDDETEIGGTSGLDEDTESMGSADTEGDGDDTSADAPPFEELYAQGVDRYLGVFTPTSSKPIGGGATSHRFTEPDGPICFRGGEFGMLTRDGAGDALMIFLQGGGACGPNGCEAVDSAPELIPPLGILVETDASNPAQTFDVGYVPYCDGTLFTGDQEHDTDDDGSPDLQFRGIQNLSASLDVIAAAYPTPRRILLTGNSAGGMGVHYALPLVRKLYPDTPIDLVNDSGVGILAPGVQDELNEYWNSEMFFPASCEDCIGEDGHLTGYHDYQLGEDAAVRMGFMSTKQDDVIVQGLAGTDGEAFEAALVASVAELEANHPERFRSMIADGDGHTFILRDFDRVVGGISVRDWVSSLLTMDDSWVSVSD